jgi:hypothetical protein
MDTNQIVAVLIQERDRLNRAIEALSGSVKRRGRPPRTAATQAAPTTPAAKVATPKPRRKARSAAQLKAHSERMKAYWAKKRKAAAKG